MSMMFRNSDQKLEKELAADDYRAHPVRNRLAVLAVALTALLIVVIFTVGIGYMTAMTRYMGASPGPGTDSAMIYGDEEILERAKKLPQVDWAAYAKRCSASYLHNQEFSGVDVRLFAADEVHYEKNMVDLIAGRYPESGDEILLSDTMSERLGLAKQLNVTYDLVVLVEGEGEGQQTEKVIPMTVCGYYKNPLRGVADIYEEIYTGKAFIEKHNPGLIKGYDQIYVKLNNLNPLKLGTDKHEKLTEVNEQAAGNGIQYKASDLSYAALAPIILLLLCVMFCGYFFIYNIFDISIENDIRFYGELKTIGMTRQQLKRMLLWQMNRISLIGIVLGGMIGYGIGRMAAGAVLDAFAEGISSFYKPAGFVQVFALGAVFSWITVLVSTMKPFRIASTISPVEAARYRGRKKKGVFSVISFALSGILFLVVYTISMGYSVEVHTAEHNGTDFRIVQKTVKFGSEEPYQPISDELVQKIREQEFVEDFRVTYMARTKPDWLIFGGGYYYDLSRGEIAGEGELARDRQAYVDSMEQKWGVDPWRSLPGKNERDNYPVSVAGMDAAYLDHESQYFTVLEGEFDAERFAQGGYLIYNRSLYVNDMEQSEGMAYQVHAGDRVSVTFFDSAADRYVEREFTVMALVTSHNIYGTDNMGEVNIWLTDEAFQEIYSNYGELIGSICFNASGKRQDGTALSDKEQYEIIAGLVEEDGNLQLSLDSAYMTRVQNTETKRSMTAFGILLAVIVGLIGVANMVNTVTTDVMARKVEYAAMQSIGMTGRQMKRDIFEKYAVLVATALGLATVAGAALAYKVGAQPGFNFSAAAFVQALMIFVGISAGLCVVMAQVLTWGMNRRSIVERLREVV